ncbi:hypothetical protein F3Y22_tig00111127pilonHSYRG00075 [Hibiscus syriacus]|uniref:Rho-GAP domain-containing protein n=1 Tax=Hibiscus syriacus TaxID=106335 RepID=A0A6A2YZ18_HIBSY|nr:hypothetical protein F3Y22_tig00111127pilonHSYRG00075 [Hibiscus syriacus]
MATACVSFSLCLFQEFSPLFASLEASEAARVKVEGILRQAADVEDVERQIREFEQGKIEFSQDEDAHVVADCVKYVIRELPSAPVPASCCNALLQACRKYMLDNPYRVNFLYSELVGLVRNAVEIVWLHFEPTTVLESMLCVWQYWTHFLSQIVAYYRGSRFITVSP